MSNIIVTLVSSAALAAAACTVESQSTEPAVAETASEVTRIVRPPALTVPGTNFFPESITASAAGTLYVASITTGEIVRFPTWSATAEVFVPAGVNIGTAGVAFDDERHVLWACAVDLTFATPTALRAFDPASGALLASYVVPNGGVCADIAIAGEDLYVTDTLLGLIYRLTTPSCDDATGGTLALWSADPAFVGAGFLQINGIAFDGNRTLYTTNYSTGELLRVRIKSDGTASAATTIQTPRLFQNPDGIRVLAPGTKSLVVTENTGALSRVDVNGDTAAITQLQTFDQPTSVVRAGKDLWVTEGQVLRLQGVDPTPLNLPFTVRRFTL